MDDTEDLLFVSKQFCSPSGSYHAEFIGICKDKFNVYLKFMPIGFRGRGISTEPILVALNRKYTQQVSKLGKQFVNLCDGANSFDEVVGKRVEVDIEVLFGCIPIINRIYEMEDN